MPAGALVLQSYSLVPETLDGYVDSLSLEIKVRNLLQDLVVGTSEPGLRAPENKGRTATDPRETSAEETGAHDLCKRRASGGDLG